VNGDKSLSCLGLLDSGADHCTFPGVFMQALGITESNFPGEALKSPGGPADLHFHRIILDLKIAEPYPIYAAFNNGMNDWFVDQAGVALLGQTGFFDKFKVTFDLPKNVFSIEI
jgi:hypothetical protein